MSTSDVAAASAAAATARDTADEARISRDPDEIAARAAERARQSKRRFSQLTRRDRIVLWVIVGVPTLIHVTFVWIPALATVVLSFTNWNGISAVGDIRLVGFRNYWEIFTVFEKDFWGATIDNGTLVVFLFLVPTALGVLLAFLLDKNLRGGRIYQSIYYTPVVLSLAVVGFMWKSVMYSPRQGLFSTILGRTDPSNQIDWLGDQSHLISIGDYGISKNFAAILIAMAWRHTGYIMVLYLAGLKSVDPALREAASIDGCTEWQAFRRVVFPAMKPINVVVGVITVIEALRAFDIVFALKSPRGMELLSILVTDNLIGEGGGNVGRGSAYGVLLLLLCVGFIIWYLVNNYRQEKSS
jgi:multiple sugar transport system permease protein